MADNSYRSYSSRDAFPRGADPSAHEGGSDPLAELARLIGQSDPNGVYARNAMPTADDGSAPGPEMDWAAADDGYGEQTHAAEEGYAPPRTSGSHRSNPPDGASWPHDSDYQDEAATVPQYSGPASAFDDVHSDETGRGERLPTGSRGQPFFPPTAPGDHAGSDSHQYGSEQGEPYAGDEYYDEAPVPRRSGTVVIVAVLGLAVLGTAGAFGYRAMFGGSILPSLPPIIKAADGPTKIVPNPADTHAGASSQADASNTGSGDRLVPHQEQPVDIPPANAAPRVINTIPVISTSPSASGVPVTQPVAPGSAPPALSAPPVTAPALGGPPAASTSSFPPSTEPKKVTTLPIRSNPTVAANTAPAAGPTPRPIRTRQPTVQSGADGPLSIVPNQDAAQPPSPSPLPPPPARTRTAMARPAPSSPAPMPLTSTAAEPGPAVGGGSYTVQVTSQRSEADAHAAYRSLQAKFPQQLGGRQAMVRRADLGPKGVYYRALVGPFASAEQAAGLCSRLKAAGGTCIIQRN